MTNSIDASVDVSLIEKDPSILLEAPLIVREVILRPVSSVEFFELLKQGLAKGLTPSGWFKELVDGGQFALARRMLPYLGGITLAELRQLSRHWKTHLSKVFDHLQNRLETQHAILNFEVTSDLEEMLLEARRFQDEWWFDLALKQLAEVERLMDVQIAEAIDERKERYEEAQVLISTMRRDLLYAEPDLRQRGMIEVVWELLGYADRLSISQECDLRQIQEICEAIRQLYQGAPLDEGLISKYRSLQGRIKTTSLDRPALALQEIPTGVPMAVSKPELSSLTLEAAPLSNVLLATLDELIGPDPTILLSDLARVKLSGEAIRNEEAAREAQTRFLLLSLGVSNEMDDLSRAAELLRITLNLMLYWSDRKNWPNEVRRDLRNDIFDYAILQAMAFLKAGHWDVACEYYRVAFRLRARQQNLIGAEPSISHYFAAYATHEPSPKDKVDQLVGLSQTSEDLEWDNLLLTAMQLSLDASDESVAFMGLQGLVKVAAEDPWLLETSLAALRNIQDNAMKQRLLTALEQQPRVLHNGKQKVSSDLDKELALLTDRYKRNRIELGEVLNRLCDATASIHTLMTVSELIHDLTSPKYLWEPTDLKLLDSFSAVTDNLYRYFVSNLPYQERDQLAESLLQQDLPAINQLSLASPTQLGMLYLTQAADNIHLLLEEDRATLRRVSLPSIEIRVEHSEWRSDGLYYCHINATNRGEIRADNLRVHFEESQTGEYQIVDQSIDFETLYPGQSRTLYMRMQPTPLDEDQEAFELFMRLVYQVPQQSSSEARSLRLRVDHFLYQRPEFQIIENPFVVGGIVKNPKLFRGRQELIDALLLEVANPIRTGSIVIFGQKRSGKSSLLYHLGQRSPDFIIPVSFDMPSVLADLPKVNGSIIKDKGAMVENELLGPLLLALVQQTIRECQEQSLYVTPFSWNNLMEKPGPSFQFRQFLEQFRERQDGRRLLFLFDEFTALMDKIDEQVIDGTIMRLLKSLIENGYFSAVLCGLTEVYEAVKRFANQLAVSQPRQVDYLDHNAASGLIQDPIRMLDGRSRFNSQQVVDEIIDLTAGSPFYIQMFCYRLVEYMNEMGIESVTGADVDVVIQLMVEGNERIDPVQFDNLYRYKDDPKLDDHDSILEGLVVHLLAHETVTKPYALGSALYKHVQGFVNEDELDETLGRLDQRRTIIQQSDEPTKTKRVKQPLRARHYRIRVDLFRRWLLANRPMDEEALRSFERRLRR